MYINHTQTAESDTMVAAHMACITLTGTEHLMVVTIVITGHMISCSVVSAVITTVISIGMDNRNKVRHAVTNFQDKFYYDYPSYKKDERRDSLGCWRFTSFFDSGKVMLL